MRIWQEKKLQAPGLVMVLAGPALAGGTGDGCYQRIHSDQHLHDNPDQVVWQMRLKVGSGRAAGEREAVMKVIAANQGHARRDDTMAASFRKVSYVSMTRGWRAARWNAMAEGSR